MQGKVKNDYSTNILVPIETHIFWENIRRIIREEISKLAKTPSSPDPFVLNTPGLTQKPLFKIEELCELFQVTKPTIYDWIKHGKLKPIKIRTRVYFLWNEVQELLKHKS